MSQEWLKARQTKYVAYATTYIIIIIAVLVFANFLANRYNKSYDATANKQFTLSDQTEKAVGDLKQDVTIQYFDRSARHADRQGSAGPVRQSVSQSPRPVHRCYSRIPGWSRAANVTHEGTAIVELGTKQEEARSFDETGVTGALVRALKGGERTVCVVGGSGEHRVDDSSPEGLSDFQNAVQKDNYKVKSISLLEKAEVPSDCTVLVVAGPTGDYVQPEVDAIKKYVEDGGRALFMLDPPLKLGRKEISDNTALGNIARRLGRNGGQGPAARCESAVATGGTGCHGAAGDQLRIAADRKRFAGQGNRVPASAIARNQEWRQDHRDQDCFRLPTTASRPTILAQRRFGSIRTRIRRGRLRWRPPAPTTPASQTTQGRFVVVGNSTWAANSFLRFNGNRNLMLNTMNWLSSDEDLISIRPKEPEDRRILLTRAQFLMLRSVSQFLLPLIVVFGGVMVLVPKTIVGTGREG